MEPGPAARPREVALVPRQDARPRRREQLPHARSRGQAPALRGDPRSSRSSATATRSTSTWPSTRACARTCCAPTTTRGWRRSRASRPAWRPRCRSLEIEPEEDEAVDLTLEARIPGLRFEQDGDTARWVPPADLQGHLEPAELEVDLDRSYADVLIWSARDGTEYLLRSETRDAARGRLAGADHARAAAAAGRGRQGRPEARRVDCRRDRGGRRLHPRGRARHPRPARVPRAARGDDHRRRPRGAAEPARRCRPALPARAATRSGACAELGEERFPERADRLDRVLAARSRPRRRPCGGAAPRPRRSRGSRAPRPSTSSAGTSRPLRWSSTMSAGPVGQSNETTPMPLLIASSRISGKPSKREESTNTDDSAMSAPMSSAGPSIVTESSSPCSLDQAAVAALQVAAPAQPQPPVRVRLRGLGPRRDQQLEALLVAEAPGGVDGLGLEVGLRARQRPHGVGDAVQRQRRRRAARGRPRGPAR